MISFIDSEENLRDRAFRAYFRAGANIQPAGDSGVVVRNGRQYVELHNGGGVLAVYRVKNDGYLRRLTRWPSDIQD